jgi:hypothetical protein
MNPLIFSSNLSDRFVSQVLIFEQLLPNPVRVHQIKHPFTQETSIMNFQNFHSQPPCSLGLQIMFHLASLYFFLWSSPYQKNHDI